MANHVLNYEPHTALFVPDNDALLFYRAIARYALTALLPDGWLYFEINPLYATDLTALLADMGTIYRKLHIVEQVALFHLRFESIHPFIDGNGRTGRLLMNLQLIQAGYPPINVKFADRRRYYEAFDHYTNNGSPEAMATLIAEYLKERLQSMLDILDTTI